MAVRAGLLISFVAAACATCAGCTSAPIDMSASDPLEAEALDHQAALRSGAARLVETVEGNGWSVSANPAEAARAILGRLIGGEDSGDAEGPADAVATYLAGQDAPFQSAVSDVEALSSLTRDVTTLAIAVASSDGRLPQAALARDIAASENALGAVRRAAAFFEAVGEQAAFSEEQTEAFSSALSGLKEAEAGLARGADALAERRWAARSGLFG